MSSRRQKKQLREPLILILAAVFLFVSLGTGIAGCTGTAENIRKIRIVIDAAYGGDNKGNTGLVNESDYSEGVTDALMERISYDSRFTALRTHEAQTPLAVSDAAAFINTEQPEFVLSIHAAYDPDPSVSGMHIYADVPSSENHEQSLGLAQQLQKAFEGQVSSVDVGYMYYEPYTEGTFRLKRVGLEDEQPSDLETWSLMKQSEIPVVITEMIHVSNADDVGRWANEQGYADAAELYYQAFCAYCGFEPVPVPEPEEEKA